MGLKEKQLKEKADKNNITLKKIFKYLIMFSLGIILTSFLLYLLMPLFIKMILIIFVVLIIIGIITTTKALLK